MPGEVPARLCLDRPELHHILKHGGERAQGRGRRSGPQADDGDRYNNLGAVAVLRGPAWDTPEWVQFAAVLPRPPASAYYAFGDVPDSDEELEVGGQGGSDASGARGPRLFARHGASGRAHALGIRCARHAKGCA